MESLKEPRLKVRGTVNFYVAMTQPQCLHRIYVKRSKVICRNPESCSELLQTGKMQNGLS